MSFRMGSKIFFTLHRRAGSRVPGVHQFPRTKIEFRGLYEFRGSSDPGIYPFWPPRDQNFTTEGIEASANKTNKQTTNE